MGIFFWRDENCGWVNKPITRDWNRLTLFTYDKIYGSEETKKKEKDFLLGYLACIEKSIGVRSVYKSWEKTVQKRERELDRRSLIGLSVYFVILLFLVL
jgi:hypothetical protein